MTARSFSVAAGVELHAEAWPGDRRPWFLLVHGLASNLGLWRGVARQLASSGFAVVAVDLRGHGRSSKPDDGYDIATVAADLAAVIDAVGAGPAVVAGQSWGGNVVLELARTRSDLLAGAVAVDGGWIDLAPRFASWDECARALAPPRLTGTPAAHVEEMLRARHPDWPSDAIEGVMGAFEVRDDGTIAPWLAFDRHMQALRGLWEDDPSARFGEIAVPVVLVPALGAAAEWSGDKQAAVDAAAAAIPRARVEGLVADHDIHAQHPEWVAKVLIDAVDSGFFG